MALERFRNPVITYFTYNLNTLPGALLYFYDNGSDTPKDVYQDKEGETAHAHPVVADANGTFPAIFLNGLYRAELKSASGVTQPNWPLDDVGTDDILVAANITASNFEAVVSGAGSPGVTWSDADAKIRLTFAPDTFRQAIGVDIPELTALAASAEASATAAAESESIAAAVANNHGEWDNLTGAFPAGDAVLHDDKVWISNDAIADITLSEPSGANSDWFNYTDSSAGGTVVSSATDTTPTRLVNVAWLTSRGIGAAHDASARTLTNPSDLSGLGIISGICDGSTLGISGLTGTDYGTLTIEASAVDTSVAGSVNLTFKRSGQIWIRSNTNATTWGAWVELQNTSSTVQFIRLAQGGGAATYGGGSFTSATDVDTLYTMDFSDMQIGDQLELSYIFSMTGSSGASAPTIALKIGSAVFTSLDIVSASETNAFPYICYRLVISKTGATTVSMTQDVRTVVSTGQSRPGDGRVSQSTNAIFNSAGQALIMRVASSTSSRQVTRGTFSIDLVRAP